MKNVILWVFSFAAWATAGWVIVRYQQYRRKTQNGREVQQYKAKLPAWVKLTEGYMLIGLWLAMFFALVDLLPAAYFLAHPTQKKIDPVGAGLIFMPSLIATLVPAMILTNVISWLVPTLRKTNLAAMKEFDTLSYRSAMEGLLKPALIVIVVTLPLVAIGIFAPWAN